MARLMSMRFPSDESAEAEEIKQKEKTSAKITANDILFEFPAKNFMAFKMNDQPPCHVVQLFRFYVACKINARNHKPTFLRVKSLARVKGRPKAFLILWHFFKNKDGLALII